jgi:ferritin-like metal-binding protein YciE
VWRVPYKPDGVGHTLDTAVSLFVADTASGACHRLTHHYPKMGERIEAHLEETLGQQRLLEGCLARYDSSPSLIKDMTARMAAFGQSVGGMAATDEAVKGGIASYAFENVEIASYTALAAAAQAAGDAETVRCCEEILPQEGDGALAAGKLPGGRDGVPGS